MKIEHCHENTPKQEHAEFKGLTRVDLQPQTWREYNKIKIMNSLILDEIRARVRGMQIIREQGAHLREPGCY